MATQLQGKKILDNLLSQVLLKADNVNWAANLVSDIKSLETENSKLYGAWSSVFGPVNTGVLLWRHQVVFTHFNNTFNKY